MNLGILIKTIIRPEGQANPENLQSKDLDAVDEWRSRKNAQFSRIGGQDQNQYEYQ